MARDNTISIVSNMVHTQGAVAFFYLSLLQQNEKLVVPYLHT